MKTAPTMPVAVRLLAFGLVTLTVRAAVPEMARYQVIVDRMPFGGVTGALAAGATPGFATRFSFVGLVSSNFTNGQLQAIFLDKTAANRAYFKGEGEMMDDVKVLRIVDGLPNRSVVLQHGLETATLTYEQRRANPVPPAVAPVPGLPTLALPQPSEAPLPSAPRRIPFRR